MELRGCLQAAVGKAGLLKPHGFGGKAVRQFLVGGARSMSEMLHASGRFGQHLLGCLHADREIVSLAARLGWLQAQVTSSWALLGKHIRCGT